MSIAHVPEEGMRRLMDHGHYSFWEVAWYGDSVDASVTVECTKCGMVLVELVGTDESRLSDEGEENEQKD